MLSGVETVPERKRWQNLHGRIEYHAVKSGKGEDVQQMYQTQISENQCFARMEESGL